MTTKATEPKPPEVSPFVFDSTLKMLIYGDYGRRKTEQLGRLIERVGMENVLMLSCDEGLGTIESLVDYNRVIRVNSWNDMQEARKRAEDEFGNLPDKTSKWVLADGVSSLLNEHANMMFDGTEKAYDLRAKNMPISPDLITFGRYLSKADKIEGPSIYGKVGRDFTRLFQSWKRLGTNLVFTFLEELTGKSGGTYEKTFPYGPKIPGNLGYDAAMSTFDYVIRLWYDTDDARTLMAGTQSTGMYEARTREDRRAGVDIPPVIKDFDLARFVEKIRKTKRAAEKAA